MNATVLTPALAYAAGRDAANRRMRAAGRSKWSVGDYNEAARVCNRLLLCLINNPEHRAFIAKDMGIAA